MKQLYRDKKVIFMAEAYCVKCKKKVEMKDAKETKTSKGTAMKKGKCPHCGTTVCRIGG